MKNAGYIPRPSLNQVFYFMNKSYTMHLKKKFLNNNNNNNNFNVSVNLKALNITNYVT